MRKTYETAKPYQTSLSQDLGALLRYGVSAVRARLGGRGTLILLGVAVAGGGIVFGWSWLTAIGLAPILLALAPCAAMCALGLCMQQMAGKSGSSQGAQSSDAREMGSDTTSASDPVSSVVRSERIAPDPESPELPFEPVDGGARLATESLRPPTSKERT
jgi:hypothetical protein